MYGSSRDFIQMYSWNLPVGIQECHKISQVRIAGVNVEIRLIAISDSSVLRTSGSYFGKESDKL
jgi:hypothetical protein